MNKWTIPLTIHFGTFGKLPTLIIIFVQFLLFRLQVIIGPTYQLFELNTGGPTSSSRWNSPTWFPHHVGCVYVRKGFLERKIILVFHATHYSIVWCETFFLQRRKRMRWFLFVESISIPYRRVRNVWFLSFVETEIHKAQNPLLCTQTSL